MASGKVGDAWVDLTVKGDHIRADASRIMKNLETVMDNAAEKIGREVGDSIADAMRRELLPEIKKMSKALDHMARDRGMKVEVDAETKAAKAEIDEAARDRTAEIDVEADTSPVLKRMTALLSSLREAPLSEVLDLDGFVGKIPILGDAIKQQAREAAGAMEQDFFASLVTKAKQAAEEQAKAIASATAAGNKQRERMEQEFQDRVQAIEEKSAADLGEAITRENDRWDKLSAAARERNAEKSQAQIASIEQRYVRQRAAAIQRIQDKADADLKSSMLSADQDLQAALARSHAAESKRKVDISVGIDKASAAKLRVEAAALRAQVEATFDKTIKTHLEQKLDIDLNEKGIIAKAKALQKGVAAAFAKKIDVDLSFGGGDITAQAKYAWAKVSAQFKNAIKAKIEAVAETRAAKAEIAFAARDRRAKIHVIADVARGGMAKIAGYAKALSGFTMLQQLRQGFSQFLTNLPMIAVQFSQVSLAIGAIGPVALQALGAIGPLASGLIAIAQGAIVAVPAVVALGAAAAIVVSAFKNLDQATGEAAKFNKNLQVMKSNLGLLQKGIQQAFFASGEFNNALKPINDMLGPGGVLAKGLKTNAAAMATFLSAGLKGLREGFTDEGITTFFDNMKTGIQSATPGLQSLGKAFGVIAVKGSSAFEGIGKKFSELGGKVLKWAESADISGMISNAAKQFGLLWDSAVAVKDILKNVFGAMGEGTGAQGLEGLKTTLEAVRDVVSSPAFRLGLTQLFGGAAAGADALRESLTPIGEALGKLMPILGSALAIAGAAASDALAGIATALSDPAVGEGLLNALKALGGVVSSIPFDVLGQSLGVILEMVGQILPVIGELLSLAAPDLLTAINSLIAPLGQIVMAFLPVINTLISAITPIVAALAPIIQGLADAFSALFAGDAAGFAEGMTSALTAIGPLITTVVDSIVGLLPTVIPIIVNLITGIAQALVTALPTLIPALMGGLMQLVQAIVTMLPMLVNAFMQLLPMLVNVIAQLIPALIQALATMLPILIQAIVTMLPGIIQAFLAMIPMLLNALATSLPMIIQAIVAMIPVLIQAILTLIPLLINALIESIPLIVDAALNLFMGLVDGLIQAIPILISALADLIPQVASALISMIPTLLAAAMQLFLVLVDAVFAIIPRILAAAVTLVASLASGIVSMVGQLLAAGVQLITALLSGIVQMFGKVVSWAKAVPGRIVSSMGNLGTALLGAGKNLIDGFIQGIANSIGRVMQAARDLVNSAIDIVKNGLRINSPSKVFIDFGKSTGEGMSIGIKSSTKQVQSAAKTQVGKYTAIGTELRNAILNGLAPTASKSSSALGKAATLITTQYGIATKKASKKQKAALKKQADDAKKFITVQQRATAKIWEDGDEEGLDKFLNRLTSSGNWISSASSVMRASTMQDIAKAKEVMQDRIDDQKKVLDDILKDFNQLKDQVSDSIRDTLQLKGLRSISQLTTGLSGMVAKAQTFAGLLQDLVKRGYPAALVQQVAALGFDEGAKVARILLGATDEQTKQIVSDYGALTTWADAAGNAVAEQMYGEGIKAQQQIIDGLTADMTKLELAGEKMAAALIAGVKKKLKISSPSKVMAEIGLQSAEGISGGLTQGEGGIQRSVEGLASVMTGGLGVPIATPASASSPVAAAAASTAAAGSQILSSGNLTVNGDLIGSDPKIAQAVQLLMEVIGAGRRLERAGWNSNAATAVVV